MAAASRVTSEVFVAALVRRVRSAGAFAYVARRGNAQAGAVHVGVFDSESGSYAMFGPAPWAASNAIDAADTRLFAPTGDLDGELALRAFVESEERFDPDFWLVEIENWTGPIEQLLPIAAD